MNHLGSLSLGLCLALATIAGTASSATTAAVPVQPAAVSASTSAAKPAIKPDYGRIAMHFEANTGQLPAGIDYSARGPGYALAIEPARATFGFAGEQARQLALVPVGGNRHAEVTAEAPLPGKSNYLIGNDPKKFRTGVAQYARVRSHEVYPGVDWVFSGNGRELEYDWVVQPGANPGRIRLRLQGAQKLSVDDSGDLQIQLGDRQIVQRKPVAYQGEGSERRMVDSRYIVKGREVQIALGDYDHRQALVIDPVLAYSTYLGGGNGGNALVKLLLDSAGSAYLVGHTAANPFPTTGTTYQSPTRGGYDIFVTKLNATGTAFIYSDVIGGNKWDPLESTCRHASLSIL